MQRRADLPPDVRRRFLSGRVSLDFTHTGGEGEYAVWEILHGQADLSRWLGVILEVDGIPVGSAADLDTARALRAAITRAARTLAAGGSLNTADVDVINAAAAGPPLIPRLRADGTRDVAAPDVAGALSTLARDAIELFGGPLAARVRVCASPTCGLLLVDTSRPGRRRWCSMQRCGNLAKVRGHRARANEQA
ncbi:CGNR zinc finger domain-containing protein [Jiangella gansuensis]|uniref:CGNR zinc finger domain-containing protein n=1 Tax=Jiangella gansuensis TaxID=281473 RepID=UPI0004B2B6F1|nr:ABATE domain-containing protein [Jiangella gansuensis]